MQICPIANNFCSTFNNKPYNGLKYKHFDCYPCLNADAFVSSNNQISFCAKKNRPQNTKASVLEAQNLRFRTVGRNYRSACPTSMNIGFPSNLIFDEFRKKGIKTLIDLRLEASTNSSYKDEVDMFNRSQPKQNRFVYKHFPIEHNNNRLSDPINKNGEEKFLTDLSELIKLMNDGGCNVSCGGGLHRTDLFYCLCYIFNPEETIPPLLSMKLSIDGNINFKIYKTILNKIKDHLFEKDKKQSFKFSNIKGIRKLTGIEFDERILDIKNRNNIY